LALAGSTDGLWDWDLLSNTVFYSDRFREILGYTPAEFPGTIDSLRSRTVENRVGPQQVIDNLHKELKI
jgi:PAS domain-containing protein